MKKMIESRDNLKARILGLPGGEQILKNGISKAVYIVNNGAGERLAIEVGQEKFDNLKNEINKLYEEWIINRDTVSAKYQYIIDKIVKKNRMVDKEEAAQEGWISLQGCLERYEEKLGLMEHYASSCIKFGIRKCSNVSDIVQNYDDKPLEDCPDPQDHSANIVRNNLLNSIWEKVRSLSSEEVKILKLRYKDNMKRVDIEKLIGLSVQRIKYIEEKALDKLKDILITDIPENIQAIRELKRSLGLG